MEGLSAAWNRAHLHDGDADQQLGQLCQQVLHLGHACVLNAQPDSCAAVALLDLPAQQGTGQAVGSHCNLPVHLLLVLHAWFEDHNARQHAPT